MLSLFGKPRYYWRQRAHALLLSSIVVVGLTFLLFSYSNSEGTGIGLIISKTLIEQMAGAIGFDSEEGQGSTFWVEFEQV